MFDLGWTELLVIGVVALIVVGPKDLPGMFRTLGRFTGKARAMARDFQRAMDDAADDAGVKDIKDMGADVSKSLKAATNPVGTGLDAVKDATKGWSSSLTDGTAGPETQKLSKERAESAAKMKAKAAEKATARKAAEAAKAAEGEAPAKKPVAKKPAAKKPAAKKTATKTPAAKKPAKPAKAPAAKPAKAPAAKTARKPAAKTTGRKSTPRKAASRAKSTPDPKDSTT